MTTAMMRQFGVEISVSDDQTWRIPGNAAYQSQDYQIEPDVSAAAYFYGMAVLSGGNVLVRHVHFDSLQEMWHCFAPSRKWAAVLRIHRKVSV